jgi:sulfur-oxidizing protein SoxZ
MAGMKIRASMAGDTADIKVLMNHPMETGDRKDAKTGGFVAAEFINSVVVTVGGNTVLDAAWGAGISKNPFLGFKVKGAKAGDKVAVTWKDNKGATETVDATIG